MAEHHWRRARRLFSGEAIPAWFVALWKPAGWLIDKISDYDTVRGHAGFLKAMWLFLTATPFGYALSMVAGFAWLAHLILRDEPRATAVNPSLRPGEWPRLNQDQIGEFAAELKALGRLKLVILPRILPDCEDLADDIIAGAIRAGWEKSEALHGTYGGFASEGLSVEPTSGAGYAARTVFAMQLALVLGFPVDVVDTHPAEWDFATETWKSQKKTGEDLLLKLGRRVKKRNQP